MSKTVFTCRPDATQPVGSLGPLTELDDLYHTGGERRLDPTPEQEMAAGWCKGPNLSEQRALLVLRSLYTPDEVDQLVDRYGCVTPLDPHDLKGRLLTAIAVGGMICDDGMPAVAHGNLLVGEVRSGYLQDVYERMLPVCDQAIAWGTPVYMD